MVAPSELVYLHPLPRDVCAECGCPRCLATCWVEVNTLELIDDERPTDQVWCPDCESDAAELIAEPTFLAKRAAEAGRAPAPWPWLRSLEPFCVCGRIVSRCDGSRAGCRR